MYTVAPRASVVAQQEKMNTIEAVALFLLLRIITILRKANKQLLLNVNMLAINVIK